MNKILLVVALVFFTSMSISAQTKTFQPYSTLGAHFFVNQFRYTDSFSNKKYKDFKPGLAVSYMHSMTTHFDFTGTLSASFVDFPKKNGGTYGNGSNNLLTETDADMRYRFLSDLQKISPYIQAGIGFSGYSNYYGLYFPTGIGVRVRIIEEAFLLADAQYRLPLVTTQDNHFYYSIGIAGTIGKIKKKKIIKPVETIRRPPAKLLPRDSDGDGIPDSADACPLVKGYERYKGCPIPDSDGDGLNDEEDSCPHIAGYAKYHGCPIPDRDGDGINDENDLCPDQPGIESNHGCPVITASIIAMVNNAAKNILFETNKYVILLPSFRGLDSVVAYLKVDGNLKIAISGYTDNVGGVEKNQILSDNRATAVLNYFVQKGINKERLTAKGYGMMMPVSDNKTKSGKAKNRRVELSIHY